GARARPAALAARPRRRGDRVMRREFLTLLGGATAAWPLRARAQQGERVRHVGVLIGVARDAETKAWVATFHKRLNELGWKVGGNLQIEERWTAGDPQQNRVYASELLGMKPDAIFAFSSVAVAARRQESHTVPIVFTAISDPVGSGFVCPMIGLIAAQNGYEGYFFNDPFLHLCRGARRVRAWRCGLDRTPCGNAATGRL